MRSRLLAEKKGALTRLTGNERTTLKLLLENSRISDVDIGAKLKVSSQAESKIRRKLERLGVIDNYFVDLDYASLGINTFALALIRINQVDSNAEETIQTALQNNLIGFYKIFKNEITHVALFAFKDLQELHKYFDAIHEKCGTNVIVKKTYVFPIEGILKKSKTNLFNTIVKEFGKEKMPLPPTLAYNEQDRERSNVQKLSDNERRILKALLQNSKISYRKLAGCLEKNDLTSRGISKIKARLEDKGIIRGYSTNLSPDKLGVKIVTFLFLKKKADCWEFKDSFSEMANKSYNILDCYRLNENSLHVLCCAFRSLEELDQYYRLLQSKNKDQFDIERVMIIPPGGILKDSPVDVLTNILDN